MIASVSGTVAATHVDSAVVEVGGVGLHVMCTPSALAALRVGDTVTLATSLVVREDSLTLYGFADDDERSTFELVQTASGVGPKLAQAMVACHTPDELRTLVQTEDVAGLCRVPGIGRKGAQRIILELKDRIGPVAASTGGSPQPAAAADGAAPAWREQVRSGLLGLGWSAKDAEAALDNVAPLADEAAGADQDIPVAELLRAALRSLAKT